MKERPILFNSEMVRAILDGRKIQTRRIMKPQPIIDNNGWFHWDGHAPNSKYGAYAASEINMTSINIFVVRSCPNGKIGDRLWVRETFALSVCDPEGLPPEDDPDNWDVIYRANPQCGGWRDEGGNKIKAPWKPSIHMPRWASRITLEITNVRAERLNDISEEDAEAEGIQPNCSLSDHANCDHHGEWINYLSKDYEEFPCFSAKHSFQTLWESIYGGDAWDVNPWVWVIEFKRIDK